MVKMPESMDECFYFTNRTIDSGSVIAWVYKPKCPKCKKGIMGKPVDPKTGKVKRRAEIYVCSECGHEVNSKEFDETLTVEIQYTCPFCGKSGEATTEYKRKSYKGVPAYVFKCVHCGEKIGITKKMKEPKKK
jgi:DNA-directed RNA polymerase subunit RPC12/RpoP